MAILGQIRSRSIFLIIVIGLALFAFVISGVFDGKGYQAQEPSVTHFMVWDIVDVKLLMI